MNTLKLHLTLTAGCLLMLLTTARSFAFSQPPSEAETRHIAAANTNYELGKRNLKLGNTYREAGQPEQAVKYLQRGKQAFEAQKNSEEQYWFAVACELLAYYYRDSDQPEQASEYLQQANNIYRRVITQTDGSGYATRKALQPKRTRAVARAELKKLQHLVANLKENNEENKPHTYSDHKPLMPNIQHNPADRMRLLNLDNHNLTTFPSEYVDFGIENLSLVNNKIETFPEVILSFNGLTELSVSGNSIRDFPSVHKLRNLRYLDFSNNNITSVDNSIGELTQLEYLNLSNNKQLKEVSLAIAGLPNLRILDVRNTALSPHQLDDLVHKLPWTNVLYSRVPPTQAADTTETVTEEGDWGNDWGDEEEDWGDDEEW